MLVAVVLFVAYESSKRASCKYGPTILISVASLLILVDPTRHVLLDQTHWQYVHQYGGMYRHNCPVRALMLPPRECNVAADCGPYHCGGDFYAMAPHQDCFTCYDNDEDTTSSTTTTTTGSMCSEGMETFACLSVTGWIVTIGMTYLGFALFIIGTLWNANILHKISDIRHEWNRLRGTQNNIPNKQEQEETQV
ncbi:expressed unknown protein [Seminavis robusta]|uniref:Uncharacterized protein n=1 Tax=Seminavis robusta TaxID=568900 RepID=A0A9N8DG02_9STRA|nr:expressed unknown protein [Seminavis robusta]|eukprot:Sro74_g040970.1 n/a (194) ;mRNA; r:131058-131639